MCHYCGCRAMPLIRDYVAEHERASDLGDRAIRAIDQGDLGAARDFVAVMAHELERHWKREENGIFRVMAAREEQYADYVAPLIVEHRELEELLATVDVSDPADQQRLRVAFEQLTEHISKEEERPLSCLRCDDGWCGVGHLGGGLVRGPSGREDDHGLI
jgi:hypothetical protein